MILAWASPFNAPDYLLNWISEGVPIPFTSAPPSFHIDNRKLPTHYNQFVSNELKTLIASGVISKTKVQLVFLV